VDFDEKMLTLNTLWNCKKWILLGWFQEGVAARYEKDCGVPLIVKLNGKTSFIMKSRCLKTLY
jgi:hypothetical protein